MKSSWDDTFYVEAYRMARCGLSNHAIARELGVPPLTFGKWVKDDTRWHKPALKKALDDGRRPESVRVARFKDHARSKLGDACKDLWGRLSSPEREERAAARKELEAGGPRARQRMYAYALLECNFSKTKARHYTGVTFKDLGLWDKDPKFNRMLNEVHEAKKDFFEGAFLELVERGDSAAVIHAAKTVNRDRGYGEKIEIEQKVTLEVVQRKEAMRRLTVAEKKALLEILAKMRGPALLGSKDQGKIEPVDAEVIGS